MDLKHGRVVSTLDGWQTLIEAGEFPQTEFVVQEEAEKFLQIAQERFPATKIQLESPCSYHPAEWVVFSHR